MNAAARLVHRGLLSRHIVMTYWLSRQQMTIFLLAFVALLSALSVIYVSNTTRMLHATYQTTLVEQDRLQLERGQLLLERGTWMMQARIEQVAEKKLGMMVLRHKSVVIIHE